MRPIGPPHRPLSIVPLARRPRQPPSAESHQAGPGSAPTTSVPKHAQRAVYASIAANVIIASAKFGAAAFTGSSAMVAEGLHSVVDAGDGVLLLIGRHRSRRPPDEMHPFGHGKELYFWTLLVAIVFFAVGGGMSVYEGVLHVRHPEPLRSPAWNYGVLGIAALVDGTSLMIGLRAMRATWPRLGFIDAIHVGKDPSVFSVVLEDLADVTGIVFAFLGIFLGELLHAPWLDGVASIAVGLLLAAVAIVLATESKGLLIGERASRPILEAIDRAAAEDPMMMTVRRPLTMQLGPREVLVAMDVQFEPSLSAAEVAQAVRRLESRIREAAPDVKHIYVEAGALASRSPPAHARR